MLSSLDGSSLAPGPANVRTAFERTHLRGFAEWFLRRVEAERPDYLIPAETKGARLLDVVIEYARDHLAEPIAVPVLYRPALSYVDPDALRGSKVLVLDDAKRTGNSFRRHCQRLAEFGVTDVAAAICFSFCPDGDVDESENREAYIQLDDLDRYMECVGQMTELVIASGLPPEVDHHLLDLRIPGRLPSFWGALEQILAGYGDLQLDAPEEDWGELRPMTLHFPRLPGTAHFPETGSVRDDGPRKVRFFPDTTTNRIVAVPVSFPTLSLEVSSDSNLSIDQAREQAQEWSQMDGSLAERLLERSRRRDPETVFRALSAFAEIDLTCGLARVIAGAFPEAEIEFGPQRELVARLYGPIVGATVADEIAAALAMSLSEPTAGQTTGMGVPLFVDEDVVRTTDRITDHLRGLVEQRTRELGHPPPERVGRSLVGISSALEVKGLLTSRCIDFGLALTTVVPYVDIERHAGGVRVSRKYRVSEQGPHGRSDRLLDNRLVAEETLAYISMHLAKRSKRFAGGPVPLSVATRVMACLRSWLRSENVGVEIRAGTGGLKVEVPGGAQRVPLEHVTSRIFAIEDGAVAPTPYLLDKKAAKELQLDKASLTIPLESCLEALKPLFDNEQLADEEFDRVLDGAAMSADQALGLSHVLQLVEPALDRLERQLNLIVRGIKHDDDESLRAEAESLTETARHCLTVLEGGWAARMLNLWGDPNRTEEVLLESMVVPKSEVVSVYSVPSAVLDAIDATAALISALDLASAEHWGSGVDPNDLPARVLQASRGLGQKLFSLKPAAPAEACPSPTRDAIDAAAESLLGVVSVLRSLAAATARRDCGPRRDELPPVPVEDERFNTVLFPDLAKSTEYARDNPFDANYEWKNTGLGIIAQWGRAFGGVETLPRQGDAQWMEFEVRGDPAVLAAAASRAYTEALAAAGLPYLSWSPRLGVHFGRIRKAEGANAISLTLDQMDKICKVGKSGGGAGVNVTQEVLDACSNELREAAVGDSLVEVVQRESADLTGSAADLRAVNASAALEAFAASLKEFSQTVVSEIALSESGDQVQRVVLPADAPASSEVDSQAG